MVHVRRSGVGGPVSASDAQAWRSTSLDASEPFEQRVAARAPRRIGGHLPNGVPPRQRRIDESRADQRHQEVLAERDAARRRDARLLELVACQVELHGARAEQRELVVRVDGALVRQQRAGEALAGRIGFIAFALDCGELEPGAAEVGIHVDRGRECVVRVGGTLGAPQQ